MAEMGAGEILLTSMDRDGTREGYDLELTRAVAERVAIPVVGMGGVQSAAHARDLLDAGARLVAVGTESFRDPAVGGRIAGGLAAAAQL
jgi:cyclase